MDRFDTTWYGLLGFAAMSFFYGFVTMGTSSIISAICMFIGLIILAGMAIYGSKYMNKPPKQVPQRIAKPKKKYNPSERDEDEDTQP